MEVTSQKLKELSESVESLDQEEIREKLAKYQTNRRLSVPRIGTATTFMLQDNEAKSASDKNVKEDEVGNPEEQVGEEGATGGLEPIAQNFDEQVPSKKLFKDAFEAMLQNRYEGKVDDEDEEDVEKTRQNTEMLLNIMECEKERKRRRGSWKSVWDEDDPEEDSKINEDIENDPGKKMLWAAENNEMEIVKELLSSQADLIGFRDEDGYTPLHRASYNGHTAMVEFLLENGAQMTARTIDGWQPIHSAARWNNPDVASLLIQAGCDVNAATNGGQTALHLAAGNQEAREILELLLMSRYIDVTMKNNSEETAYDIARRTGRLAYLFEMQDRHLQPSS